MADAVLNPSGGLIPAGTTVTAHFPWFKMLGHPPSGPALATAVVTDQGTATFSGLASGTAYTAYALVGAVHRYIDFTTDVLAAVPGTVDLSDVYSQLAGIVTRLSALESSGPGLPPDASTSTKGLVKLASSPANPAEPMAIGDNDTRLQTLAGYETRFESIEASISYLNDAAQPQLAELDARVTTVEDRQVYDVEPTASQPSGAYSATGLSAPRPMLRAGTLQTVWLAVATAPVGGPVTVEFLLNDVVITTLQILSGSTDTVLSSLSQPIAVGDELRVNATQVGSTTPAMGVLAGFYVTG